MADAPEEKWADFNPLTAGSSVPGGDTPAPQRGWSGALMDTGLDLAKSVTSVGKQVAGVREGVVGAVEGNRSEPARAALRDVDTFSDISTVLEGYKTPRGQELTRQPESFSQSPGKYLVNTAINMAPYIPIAVGTGGLGAAAAFGALGFGQVRSDLRENLRNASPEELAKNPQYVDARDKGMTHEQAVDEVYLDATDPQKLQTYLDAAPNVVGQAVTGGFGGSLVKGFTHSAMRKAVPDIVANAMARVEAASNKNLLTRKATGVGLGAASGATAGAGQDLSRQLSEQSAGQQREGVNWGDVGDASSEMATMFATMGLAHKGTPKVKVPPVGTHIEAAAREMGEMGPHAPYGPRLEDFDRHGPELPSEQHGVMTPPEGPHLGDFPAHGPELPTEQHGPQEAYGPTAVPDPISHGSEPGAAPPIEPGRPMEGADIYRGMAPPEGSAPLPYGETYAPRPGEAKRKPIVTGGKEPGETGTGVPVAGKLVEPPGPAKPHSIATDAKYVGDTYDGRQIWESGGVRQYVDPETGARRTESRKKSGDPEFRTAEEIPPAHRVTPESIDNDQAQLAALMESKNPATRGSMAARLEGAMERGERPKLSLFPEMGQRLFGNLREKIDQLLHHDPEGTIASIKGDVVPIAKREKLEAIDKDRIDALHDVADPDHMRHWGQQLSEMAGPHDNLVPYLRWPKDMRTALEAMDEGPRRDAKAAIIKNAREAGDHMAGVEHKPTPPTYAKKGEVSKVKTAAAKERKAEATAVAEAEEKAKPLPPADFGEPGEARTEIPYDPYAEEFGHELTAPEGYQPSEPSKAGAKAMKPGDIGMKGGKVLSELRNRLALMRGEKLTLPPQTVSTQFKGKVTTRKEPVTLAAGLQAIKDKLEMKRAERRAVAEKIRSLTTEGTTGRLHESVTPRIAVVERGKVEGRVAADRQRKAWTAEEAAEMADVHAERMEQAMEELKQEKADKAAHDAGFEAGLEEYKNWEAEMLRERGAAWGRVEIVDFFRRVDEAEAASKAEVEKEIADAAKLKDADRTSSKRKSDYRVRDLISKPIVRSLTGKITKITQDLLNRIVKGIAVDPEGKYITEEGRAREEKWKMAEEPLREKAQQEYNQKYARYIDALEKWEEDGEEHSGRAKPSEPKLPASAAVHPYFRPFLDLPLHELKGVANEFIRLAMERINIANERFEKSSLQMKEKNGRHWTIGTKVGGARHESSAYYNQLVDDRIFAAAALRYMGKAKPGKLKLEGGNKRMLQVLVMNHWISQKLALEGNPHKMQEFYKERNNALREEMMEKYNLLSTSTDAGERLAAEKNLKKAMEILEDDAKRVSSSMEDFQDHVTPQQDIWQQMEEAGLGSLVPEGKVPDTALKIFSNFLSNDIREQYARRMVDERRARKEKIATERAAGEARFAEAKRRAGIDRVEERMAAIHGEGWLGGTTAEKLAMLETYEESDYGRLGRPVTPKGEPIEPGRPMHIDDIDSVRSMKLTERAQQILDQIETDPRKASDPKLQDELRLIEDEMRQHYENAVPEARDKDFGLGKVFQNGSDLSKHDNLPKGAYVRRVSDFLKEGQRGIRSGLDKVGGRLRNHLLDIAHRAVGDMEVVALTSEQMDMAAREKSLPGDTPSFYDPNTHRVFISQRVLHSADRDRILGHELAHPLTLRAAELYPHIAKKLDAMRVVLKDAYENLHDPRGDVARRVLDGNTQALNNLHEFVGELYNDGGRVADALHAIETPGELRTKWRTDTLSNAFGDVLSTIKTGLNKLLFSMSKKRLLNDATLNSLHLFDRMEDYGRFRRPSRTHEALPYTPKREMGNEEAQRWSSYPVHRITDVFDPAFTGRGRNDGGASFAVKEDGQIHDVGLHDKHTNNMLKARGLPIRGMKVYDPFLSPKHPTYRPWVHISKWTGADGKLALGIEHSEQRTAAQDAVLKKIIAEGNKARRRGDDIYMTADEYRHVEGRDYASDEGIRKAIKGGNKWIYAEEGKADDTPSFEDFQKRMKERAAEKARTDSKAVRMEGDDLMQWAQARSKGDPFLNRTLKLIEPLIRNDLSARIYPPEIWRELPTMDEGKVLGSYHDMTHYIQLPMDASPDTIVHEMLHAATSRALERNKPFKAQIRGIMAEVENHPTYKDWYSKQEFRDDAVHPDYFMKDPHEFIAEFYSKPQVRALLDQIPASQKLLKNLRDSTMFGRPSVFRMMLGVISKFLRGDLKKAGGLNIGLLSEKLIGDVLRFQKTEVGPYKRTNWLGEDIPGHPTHYSRIGPPDPSRKPTSMEEVTTSASEGWKNMKFRLQRMGLSGALLKASTFVELRRRAEQGMQHVVRAVEDVWSKVETTARRMFTDSGAEDIARSIAEQMRMPPAVFQKLQDYVNLENHWKVSGEDPLYEGKNSWVSKDSPYHEHYRDRHATLSAMYNDLSPDQKALRRRMLDYYESQHDKVLRANLDKVIRLRDMVPGNDAATTEALIKHVLKDDLSDHEKTLLDAIPGYESEIDLTNKTPEHIRFRNNMRELRGNPLFKKVEGVWYPAKRRGNYVVEGRYDLSGEALKFGGRKVDEHGNTWEFDDADKAQKFYEAVSGSEAYGGIHFEGKTEHVYQADEHGNPKLDSEGKPIPETYYSERTSRKGERPDPSTPEADKVPFTETTVGGHRRVTAKEAEGREGTVTRHRVEFNPLLLEFYENPRHAYERHAELQGDANLKLTHVEPKRDTSGTYLDPKKASKVMETLFSTLEHGRGWAEMDPTTRALTRRDLEEAAVQHIMSSSARSMRIPRRYALGADKSLLRDFVDYAHNTARTLAELHHREDLSAALKGMDDYVKDNRMWTAGGDPQNKYGELRAKLQTEVHNRIFTRPSDIVAPFWSKALARVLQVSYLDKLMSPGFVVLNATEPWVLGAPLLTGHHGFKAYSEIGKAYAALGFHGVWGKGVSNAVRAAVEGTGAKFEDNHTLLTERLKGEADAADLIAMHNYGAERGYFDRDAGMEMASRVDPSTGKIGQGLDYMDNISRQVNVQIENVNRSVMAIASYRLGRQKGWSHEKSMQHAFDMVHDTSGNYGHWNTPAMFNDPRLKFALQFKRYSQRITAMYVRMFAQAFGDAPPEVKSVARKQLGVMMGSQIIFSGALGLPTEPIKAALLLTSPITGFGPDEAETWAREATAKVTGNDQLAEGLMRGFPRAYLDIGLGTRLGHDSIWTHGTLGKKPDNWFASLGHFMGGAPASYMVDLAMSGGKMADSIANLSRGNMTQAGADFTDFAQLALPFKLGSDMISSATNYLGGPKTMSTAGQPLGYQPSVGQALLEAAGIRSGTQQEASDKRFALSQSKAQYATFKNSAFQMYVRAGSPAEQRAIEERAIAKSKEDWPKGMQLTHGDFFKAKQRFARNQSVNPDDVGVSLSKREAGLRDRFAFFNN
jgi:hypothetical protein